MGDNGLEDAIRTSAQASVDEAGGTPGLVLTNYVVVAAMEGWDSDGHEIVQVVVLPHGPGYAVGGLLHEATIRNDADTLDNQL